jgi:Zn-dependent protease with chaperone function
MEESMALTRKYVRNGERKIIGSVTSGFPDGVAVVRDAHMKLQEVKSGAAYKRAFVLAKDMGTRLKRVYIVPAGRGHLTNAFGLSRSIALTDNYGRFLHGAQLDFVIGHELAHVKRQHGRKELAITVTTYAILGTLALIAPRNLISSRPLFDLVVLLAPILALYYVSRRFEYEADRTAVQLTRDPEAGIKALTGLYRITQAPTNSDRVTELFMSHPSLVHRARAIGEVGEMPEEEIESVIREGDGSTVSLGQIALHTAPDQ